MRSVASRRLFPAVHQSHFRDRAYLLAYDGQNGGNYGIGLATSSDGYTFHKITAQAPALFPGASGTWNAGGVKDPCILKFGATDYRMWHSGYSSSTAFQIGYATSTDGIHWTPYPANPILGPSGSGWDGGAVQYPCVFYEPTDVSRPFKMWYCGTATVGAANSSIGYAYSTDGINWTKSTSNPVLTYTAAGFSTAIYLGCITKVGSTYYSYCNGRPTPVGGISGDVVCLFTFTNPEGTYTAGGTLLSPSTAEQALTANLAAGGTSVSVSSASAFHVNEPCLLNDSAQNAADCVAGSVGASSIGLLNPASSTYSWTTANSASIRSYFYGSLNARSILSIAGSNVLFLAPFQQFAGTPFQERTAAATSSSLTSGWAFDYVRGIVLPLGSTFGNTAWDQYSVENPSVISE